jgi:hypothetical protein
VHPERILKLESDALLIPFGKCKHKLRACTAITRNNFFTSEQMPSLRANGYKVTRTR